MVSRVDTQFGAHLLQTKISALKSARDSGTFDAMPDPDPRLTRVRDAFVSALAGEGTGVGWSSPSPEILRPLFPAFEIEALLGRGGMGAVYRARQRSLDRLVAIKILPFELGVQEDFAERFHREATALARLSHPNIVSVHDFGQANDGHFFMVMEYVDGADLAARLRCGPLPLNEALSVVQQICDALEYAHARGVVHRDIKPGNILLDAYGRVKVTDFGIAHLAADESRTALTAAGAILGTPEYVAPEQAQPAAVIDARADVFSVGVMLYEALTGQLPRGVFRPISQIVPATRTLDRVIARALQSDPAMRYASVRELRAELCEPARPRRKWLAAAAAFAAAGGVVIAWQSWPRKVPVPDPSVGPKSFVNSLGQRFVPAGTPGVLFCTTEARVRDFAAFARATQLPAYPAPTWMNFTGTDSGWRTEPASWKEPGFPQTDDHPVVGVTYAEAVAFCEWLTAHERSSRRIGAKDRYRLPTNAEWSVAAGLAADAAYPSGTYSWGTGYPPSAIAANYASEDLPATGGNYAGFIAIPRYRDGFAFTAPVGSFPATAQGLFDLAGNAWEWTEESSGPKGTLRGGGWVDGRAEKIDLATRIEHPRTLRCYAFGFRLVFEAD